MNGGAPPPRPAQQIGWHIGKHDAGQPTGQTPRGGGAIIGGGV